MNHFAIWLPDELVRRGWQLEIIHSGAFRFVNEDKDIIEFIQTVRSEASFGALITTMFYDGVPAIMVTHDRGGGNSIPRDGDFDSTILDGACEMFCNTIEQMIEDLTLATVEEIILIMKEAMMRQDPSIRPID